MIKSFSKNNFYHHIFLILFFLISINYIYVVFAPWRDEIGYLSDKLLFIEGINLSYSHVPTGISTWFSSIILIFEIVYNFIKEINFSILKMYQIIDKVIYQNYLDLTKIKLSIIILNTIFLYFLYQKQKNELFYLIFLILALAPGISEVTFSGKSYFLGSIFAALSLVYNFEKKRELSIVFLALATGERLEYFLLSGILLIDKSNLKNIFKNYLIYLILFCAISPWFFVSIIQNLKVILAYVFSQKSTINDSLRIINISLLFLTLVIFYFNNLLKSHKKNLISLLIVVFLILYLTFTFNIALRWFGPIFLYIIFYFSTIYEDLINAKYLRSILLIVASFLFMFHFFNKQNYYTDIDILDLEKNSGYKEIIGFKLLKEDANFNSYYKISSKIFKKENIKNDLFFQLKPSPIFLSEVNNLEILHNRRYQYLSRYNRSNNYNKYISTGAGLYPKISFWCQILKNKDTGIVSGTTLKIKKCKD